MEDPIITTRAAAELLGVSIRTAQTWIEQNAIESWKTPGGHRRVRRSSVIELMGRLGKLKAQQTAFVVVHASQHRLQHFTDALAAMPECAVIADSDPYATLLSIGYLMPSLTVVELNRMDRERLQMIRRIGQHPHLGHTHILAVGDANLEALAAETELGSRLHTLPSDWRVDSLQGRVRGLILAAAGPLQAADEAADEATDEPAAGATHAAQTTQSVAAANEAHRLLAVAAAGLIDTPQEEAFDEITRLAARSLDVPIALLTLLTPERQWFKSHWGLERSETPRSWAFCNYTVLERDLFMVEDAHDDPRFAANPLVTGEPYIRFYAGASVRDVQGYPLGSLCVIDRRPRRLDATQQSALVTLAHLASDRINLRIRERQLRWSQNKGR